MHLWKVHLVEKELLRVIPMEPNFANRFQLEVGSLICERETNLSKKRGFVFLRPLVITLIDSIFIFLVQLPLDRQLCRFFFILIPSLPEIRTHYFLLKDAFDTSGHFQVIVIV